MEGAFTHRNLELYVCCWYRLVYRERLRWETESSLCCKQLGCTDISADIGLVNCYRPLRFLLLVQKYRIENEYKQLTMIKKNT